MKILAIIGDSHGWGQGAHGVWESIEKEAPVEGGELRPVPFRFPCFANLIRTSVEAKTGSSSHDKNPRKSLPVTFSSEAGLIRLFLTAEETDGEACVSFNGEIKKELFLPKEGHPKPYKAVTLFLDKPGEIEITGNGSLYRVEEYFGSHAVVNCSVGSTPTFRYLENFWETYVALLLPEEILIEPCTINDWLSGETPEEYKKNLLRLFIKALEDKRKVACLGCTTIMGRQESPATGVPYSDYLAAAKEAALSLSLPFADTAAVFKEMSAGLSEKEAFDLLFSDNWHPNDRGHAVYARLALDIL